MISTTIALCLLAAPPKPTQELLDKGKAAYVTNCMACHGEKGSGDGPGAIALNPKPRSFATQPFKQGDKPDDVFKTLTGGVPGSSMVAFNYIPEGDRWALVYWVLELKQTGPATDAGTGAAKKK